MVRSGPGCDGGLQPRLQADYAADHFADGDGRKCGRRQFRQARIGSHESAERFAARGDYRQSAAHVFFPIRRTRLPGEKIVQAAGDGLDRRERIVQLVAEHAHQTLPGLQLLFAQRAR